MQAQDLSADIERVLLPAARNARRVGELGRRITADYAGVGPLLVCGILRGSVVFFSDLIRSIGREITLDFLSVASYGLSSESSGQVRIVKDLEESVEGRHLLLVEDIVDSGTTLRYLKELLGARKPASLKVCALLDKPSRRLVEIDADYLGFAVPDEFLVGYGLDYAQKYRNLPDVCVLKRSVYENAGALPPRD